MSNREERIADRHLDKITINYFDKLVQITCDEALKNYLEEPGNGAVELSAHILKEHKKRQKSELKISKDSLAIEILAHTYADIFSETVSSAELHLPAALSKAVLKLMKQVHAHTEIIDCGESDVDNNRWIWDLFQWLAARLTYLTALFSFQGTLERRNFPLHH